jgi:hypothetical protein
LAFKTHEIIGHIIYYFRNAAVKIEIAPDAEGGVGASKNGKNGAKTCQAFILFFSGTLCC